MEISDPEIYMPKSGRAQPQDAEQTLSAMESLLAKGREAMVRHDAFMAEHQLELGMGERELTGPRVPPTHREVFRRLIFELGHIRQRIEELHETVEQKNKQGAVSPVSFRSVNHRYRI